MSDAPRKPLIPLDEALAGVEKQLILAAFRAGFPKLAV
mgnify:CR=1 FL=1